MILLFNASHLHLHKQLNTTTGIHVRGLKPRGGGSLFGGPPSCYVQCSVGKVDRRTKAVQVSCAGV